MLAHISGYRITETLHSSTKSIVYLAARDSDDVPVVIKTLNEAYPNHQQIARFLHEVDIHKKINNIQGVASVYNVENHGHQQALVLEYISGGELAKQLNHTADNFIELFFKSAMQIADALSAIHQHGIIHKDIKPKNILWQPHLETIKIIDFGIASESANEKQSQNSLFLTGSLPFLSPEQTGRMNRSVDYRSDFYSLGVTFYKLLSGELPFDVSENDPMAWVHCHIARTPKPLIIKESAIAPALSAIINKLMAKNAEDRYQSALGLKNDLQYCYSQWQSTGTIGAFIAGQMDVIDRFDIPQKLYGREQELALLSEAFAEVARGDCQLFLVNGFSGIGKSVLINEIHKPIVAKNGYFISGKFDQFQRNIPYSALVQALRGLMRQLLTEPSERLYQWRNKLLGALGSNGQVLIDFIPELEQIIGTQQPVPHLGTEENQNRFNYVALQFLQLFARKKHPLVLFIDDLQWMDSASLHLIRLFMLSEELSHFLLLGAYRANEMDAYHPLMLMIGDLKKAQIHVFDLTLKPLQLPCINQLVSESICTDAEKTLPLAQTILDKTDGNPFFINQFLKQSVDTGLLTFDAVQKSWQWDLDGIRQQPSCDNVVDLMVAKMARLSPVTQNLLRLSACIGSVFDLHTLAVISEKSVQQVAGELWPAVTAGLLIAQGDEHALLKGISAHSTVVEQDFPNAVDKFLHDRVQQAAYSLIADNQKQEVHLKIGRLLLQNTPESELDNVCFDIVEHYNKSIALLTDETERYRLAELNLIAGQKAKEATAYYPALLYFKKAVSCLSGLPDSQALRFAVEKGQIECHFLLSEIDAGLQQADALLEVCQNVTDKVELNNLLILYYGGAGQMDKAIDIALDSLRLFAMDIPRNPKQAQLLLELARAKLKLGRKTADDLSALPLIEDESVHAVFSLLKELIAPTYLQGLNQLLPYIILRMFNLTLTHGNGPVSSFAYSGYALLWSKLGDFAEAHRFGVLAMDYNKHVNNPPMEARCYFMSTSFALYWGEALENSQQPRKIGLQKLIDTGEYFWASYIYLFGFWQEVVLSRSLNELIELSKKEQQFAHKAKQIEPYYVHTLHHNLFKNLAGQTDYPDSLDNQHGEEAEALAYFEQNATSTMGTFYHVVSRLVLHYSYEQYEQAFAIATQAHITDEVIRDGTYTRVIYTFYSCLSMLAIIKSKTQFGLRKADYHVDYVKHKRTIKQWYTLCPENFAVMWTLLCAEEARIAGKNTRAIDYYDLALSAAKANKSLWFESLVNELTAKFWLQKNKQTIASVFMTEASYLYYRWGALRKVALLEKNYPELLSRQKSNADLEQATLEHYTTNSTSSDFALDIHTLLKASQTLSGEIVMEKLLQKLMHFLIENAGAQRGVLILKEQDGYVIEAECTIEQEQEIMTQQSMALSEATNLATTIIRYVLRSKETVLLGDTVSDQRFINDSYLQQAQVKSLLCLPLLDKGLLSGILYLENNIANNAFTPDRVEILQILSAEIAISLENARLYRQLAQYNQTLEETVRARTADLRAVNESLLNKNSEIQQATKIIEEKNNNITKSILYAQKIQAAMLPQAEKIAEDLPDYFILFRPKEIVSGDFYWCNRLEGKLFIIVGDCTGHGVPGAFLSTIGHMLLNKIILEKRVFNPALILAVLHEEIKIALRQQFDLLSFRKLLIENNIVLSFEGKMSQGVLVALVETLKERLATNTDDVTQHIVRKIYGVFVELAQNIQNHSLEKVLVNQQAIGIGIIVIREDEHKFVITSGNKLLNVDAEKLRSYCDVVNALGEDGLKKMYKEKLRMARQRDVIGAGIGLIDIIRKSNHPIVYTLQAVDEITQFFTLSVTLFKIIP